MDAHDDRHNERDALHCLRERHPRLFLCATVACLMAGLIVPLALVAAGFGSISTSADLLAKYSIVLPGHVSVARVLLLVSAGISALSAAAVLVLARRAWAGPRRTGRLYLLLASMALVFTAGAILLAWRLMW
jgi:hypothetical protein